MPNKQLPFTYHCLLFYFKLSKLRTKPRTPFVRISSCSRSAFFRLENAPITILKPEHSILNYPNKITQEDFKDWVQERGLYFPNEWSKEYEAILSCNDPGEPAREGGLLVARHGKGSFIYTGYSWFRELPAGVPGAYRLFVNLISYKAVTEIDLGEDK